MTYLVKAIRRLKPEAEFSFTENDYATIKWDVLDGNAPTQAEINAAIELVKADEANEQATRDAAKASAKAKLEALGLTLDDLAALGL